MTASDAPSPIELSVTDRGPNLPLAVGWLSTAMAVASGLILTALMLLTVLDVMLRTLTDSGIVGSIEVSESVLAAAVFLGMAPAETGRVHVRSSILVDRLSDFWGSVLRLVGWVLTTAFLAFLTAKNFGLARTSFEIREFRIGVSDIPVWPSKIVVLVGLAAFTVVAIYSLVAVVVTLRRGRA